MKSRLKDVVALALLVACSAEPQPQPGARKLHERLLTLDTHLDTPAAFASDWDIMTRHRWADDLSQVDYPRMRAGGLDGGFWAIYTAQGPRTPEGYARARDAALLTAVRIRELAARQPEFVLASRADDAAAIAAEKKRVVFLSIENSYPLSGDLSLLDTFYQLGVRMVGPVHTTNNDFADSSTDAPEWHGLSERGRELVGAANRLGMVLDASHASDEVLDQLLALSKSPIILSHSGCKAIFDHRRNVDDARLRALAAQGGVIQINSLSDYLIATPEDPARKAALKGLFAEYGNPLRLGSERRAQFVRARRAIDAAHPAPRASFEDYMAHLLHALKLLGPDHVGVGADWDGGGGVSGMEDVSAIPRITERLLAEGYDEAALAKIWSGNVLRLLRAAEQAR
jgi:membrane dipeptidase